MKGKRMDTDYKLHADPTDRLPALFLAAAATLLIFAAINFGFTPHAPDLATRMQAAQPVATR